MMVSTLLCCSRLPGIPAGILCMCYVANPAQALGRADITLETADSQAVFLGTADVCSGPVPRSPTPFRAFLHP